jgi:hypothetical protein
MTDDLDRMLISDEVLTPSPGFTASVMDAVRETAAQTPTIKFPWLRFLISQFGGILFVLLGGRLFLAKAPGDLDINQLAAWAHILRQIEPNGFLLAALILLGSLLIIRLSVEFTS